MRGRERGREGEGVRGRERGREGREGERGIKGGGDLCKQTLFNLLPFHLLFPTQFSSPSSHWVPFAEQAIVAIYKLAEHPDKVCGGILKALAKMVYGEKRREVGEGEQEGGGTVVENPDTPPSSQGMCARI